LIGNPSITDAMKCKLVSAEKKICSKCSVIVSVLCYSDIKKNHYLYSGHLENEYLPVSHKAIKMLVIFSNTYTRKPKEH